MDMTPGLKKRRERAERQRTLREQQESILRTLNKEPDADNNSGGDLDKWANNNNQQVSRTPSRQDMLMNAVNKIESEELLGRENSVKDLTQKLANQNLVLSPSDEKVSRLGDMSGLISKAMEGLTKSKSKSDLKVTGFYCLFCL
jgi:FH1/FH2 domain-containing protein 3